MRESQMKKIIAAAVATAFVAPVMAADVTVSGSQEFSYKSVDGTTTTETDGNVTITMNELYTGWFEVKNLIAPPNKT